MTLNDLIPLMGIVPIDLMEIFPIDVMEIIPVTVMGSIGYGNYWLKLNGLIPLRGISFHKAYGKMGPYTTKVMV